MQIQFNRKFFKDLAAIGSKQRSQIEHFINQNVAHPEMIEKSGKLEKLKGYQNYYKIRIGDYRLGILHRKEVYKKFP